MRLNGTSAGSQPMQSKQCSVSLQENAESSSYEITLRVSRPLLLRVREIAFYLLLAYAASMTVPLVFNSINTGLDPSWTFASNYFPGTDYKYGPDVIFTFGPLGFIYWPENVNWNLSFALVARLIIWALLIGELFVAYRRLRLAPFPCFLALLCLVVAQPALTFMFDYILVTAALLFIVRDHPEAQKFWRATFPLSIVISLVFLAKASGYMMLMPAFLVYFAAAYWRDRRKPSRASVLRFGWVLIAPFVAYLVYNPSVSGLWAYVTASANIVGGFSDAMSTSGLPSGYPRLVTFVILLLGFALYAAWRKWLTIETIACVNVSLFVGFKHGIVRADHEAFFYAFGLLLFAVLVLNCSRVKAAAVAGGATCVALCILSLMGMDRAWNALSVRRWSPAPQFEQVDKLFQWRKTIVSMAEQTEANLRTDALPDSLLASIHGAPVVIFPWELGYGPANHLNLVPLYTLQSYAAYTNWLDRATADHLARTPPDARLLIEWKGIDERHPLLDVPATWDAIFTGFEAELATPDVLLLKKRERPVIFNFQSLKQTRNDIHQWQNVPDREWAVRAGITLSPTLLGIGRRLLYKINPVYMELETDRSVRRFRIVPDVLRYPFVINCLPLDGAGLESLVFGNMCRERVKRFRFSGDGLDSFSPLAEIAFSEAPAARLRFAAKSSGEQKGAAAPVKTDSSGSVPGATFGNELTLSGYSIPNKTSHTEVELRWKALQKPSNNYTVFVHALDSKGGIAFQFDHVLKNASGSATNSWAEGDTVSDLFTADPPRNCAPGMYVLRIGLYVAKPFKIVPLTQTTLQRPGDEWNDRAVLITNVECKVR